MKIFIDTASLEEIEKASEWGIIDGVTTNPTLVAKEGKDFIFLLKEICRIIDGPVSAEVTALDSEGMIRQARELSQIAPNIVIKVPICQEGLKAIRRLSKENIKTNATLIFSASQALLAAKAGATFVSPFVGRLDDIGHPGNEVVKETAEIFRRYNFKTEIIAASVRSPIQAKEAALAGADIATIPFKVIQQMVQHPLTDIGIKKFLDDWKTLEEKKKE